jgi:radical SAM-linked protein
MVYRPVRERRPKELLDQTLTALKRTGYDELSLLALSADDYSCLQPFLQALMDRLDPERVAVSLPSLRADSLTQETAELIRRVRATGFTLAPEAGSERLRSLINKNLTQAEILAAAGWRLLKLYFMVGLSTETDEDLVALVELVKLIVKTHPGLRLNVSLAGFVPKAHPPFQWEAQQPAEEIDRRMGLIKSGLRRLSAVRVKWNSPEVYQLDGLLSRGDRRLGRVILGAWRRGARFEAWSEHFRLAPWAEALAEAGLSLADCLGPRDPAAPLPWEHLRVVDRDFLLAERTKARGGEQTPDCRTAGCQGCGVCDFETVQPVTFAGLKFSAPAPARPKDKPRRLALSYHKLGPARFLGHLEMALLFHRAFRRAGLKPAYSQGFHPQPRVSFLGALPVGAESLDEWAEVELLDHRPPGEIMKLLNKELPLGLSLTSLALGPARLKPRAALYRLSLAEAAGPALERDRVAAFLAAAEVPFERRRPDKTQRLDLRPAVEELRLVYDAEVEMVLDLTREGATPKPEEVAAAVFGRPAGDFRVLKLKTLMAGEKP